MAQSFMSEHSVEYYIVPEFTRILSTRFATVLPLFYWATREGNSTSRTRNVPRDRLTVCALFPRRPKFVTESVLAMKVNAEVIDSARQLNSVGVPTFLGIPLVQSIWELGGEFKRRWFHLAAGEGASREFEIEIHSDRETHCDIARSIEPDEVVRIFESNAIPMFWVDAVAELARLKRDNSWNRFFFGPLYKPVYFLVARSATDSSVAL